MSIHSYLQYSNDNQVYIEVCLLYNIGHGYPIKYMNDIYMYLIGYVQNRI